MQQTARFPALPALNPRDLYRHARRLIHPVVDSFLPVTYTPEEYRASKRRLDPTGARQRRDPNSDTADRIARVAAMLNVDARRAEALLDDAHRVCLRAEPAVRHGPRLRGHATDPEPPHAHASVGMPPAGKAPELASPMCCEDRYTTYVVTRAVAPTVVVETGVAHGVSSAYILAAMEAAGSGKLISVELTNDPRIGQLVPDELRPRWTLRFGHSLQVLPDLLAQAGPIDMFVHDSWHRCSHVRREFELVWPHLKPGGLLCAHDILASNAFPRFIKRHRSEIGAWIASVNLGLIRKAS